MAMGPGVCLEYGGMRRYDPSRKRDDKKAGGGSDNTVLIIILLAIIVALVAMIFSGTTVADLAKLL